MTAFVGIAFLLVITPGADTMLVLRSVLGRGHGAGFLTILGITAGCAMHATLSALGLSIIIMKSAWVFDAVKWAGAAYLAYLGIQSVWRAVRGGEPGRALTPSARSADWRSRSFREGFLTNILNPKVAIFYLALLPQFISSRDSVFQMYLLLAGIHMAMGVAWLSLLVMVLDRLRGPLTHPTVNRWLHGTTGVAFVALGARLATERR